MAVRKSSNKSAECKKTILKLYKEQLKQLDFPVEQLDILTSFGKTRVLTAGNDKCKKIVLFHGVPAGSPLTLARLRHLVFDYKLYVIDAMGQATKRDKMTTDIKGDAIAKWADDVLNGLFLEKADFVGIAYGAFILQKLITHRPLKINKSIFIVPSGLVNGAFWPSLPKLSWSQLRKYFIKKDKGLKRFIQYFVPADDPYLFEFQNVIWNGGRLGSRRASILKPQDVAHFSNPVYVILADDDAFFSIDKIKRQVEKIFQNLKEVYVLPPTKANLNTTSLSKIEQKIKEWIN